MVGSRYKPDSDRWKVYCKFYCLLCLLACIPASYCFLLLHVISGVTYFILIFRLCRFIILLLSWILSFIFFTIPCWQIEVAKLNSLTYDTNTWCPPTETFEIQYSLTLGIWQGLEELSFKIRIIYIYIYIHITFFLRFHKKYTQ